MDRKTILSLGLLIVVAATLILAPVATATPAKVMLGAKLYFDANLSEPAGQACADCHQPFAGYADPEQGQPVSEGVIQGRFGGRNAPSAAYMGKSPVLAQDADGVWIGGAFWDGRASGWTDKLPLIEQAKGPFTQPRRDEQRVRVGGRARREAVLVRLALQGRLRLERVRGHRQGVSQRGRRDRGVRELEPRQHVLVPV